MAQVYELETYRKDRIDTSSASVSYGEYRITAGEFRARQPLPPHYAGAEDEKTKYLSKSTEFEWSPDVLEDHSWQETRRKTTYETVAESDIAENEKRRLMLDLFRIEPHPHARSVADRLEHLHEIEQDEDEGPISLGSLATLLGFLAPFASKREPAITVTPDGNMYATWKAAGGRHCGIELVPIRTAKLVLILPGEADTGSGVHIAAVVGTTELERILRFYDVHTW